MWRVVKIFAIASLLCPLASALATESCAEEGGETSLAHKRAKAVKKEYVEHSNEDSAAPACLPNGANILDDQVSMMQSVMAVNSGRAAVHLGGGDDTDDDTKAINDEVSPAQLKVRLDRREQEWPDSWPQGCRVAGLTQVAEETVQICSKLSEDLQLLIADMQIVMKSAPISYNVDGTLCKGDEKGHKSGEGWYMSDRRSREMSDWFAILDKLLPLAKKTVGTLLASGNSGTIEQFVQKLDEEFRLMQPLLSSWVIGLPYFVPQLFNKNRVPRGSWAKQYPQMYEDMQAKCGGQSLPNRLQYPFQFMINVPALLSKMAAVAKSHQEDCPCDTTAMEKAAEDVTLMTEEVNEAKAQNESKVALLKKQCLMKKWKYNAELRTCTSP